MVLGLFPDIIATFDSHRICFVNLDSNTFFVLNINPEDYRHIGNILVINSEEEYIILQIKDLLSAGVVYKLFGLPEKLLENNLHDIPIKNVLEKNILNGLFLVTIVLDQISELPELHYPYINGIPNYKFTDAFLGINEICSIIEQLKGFKKLRLLGKDILNHGVLDINGLEDIDIETIVDYDYFVSHIEDINNLHRQLNIVVYINNIYSFDDNRCRTLINKNISVSYYCKVKSAKDVEVIYNMKTHIIPVPADTLPLHLQHYFLDYSMEDIKQMRITKAQMFLNKTVNAGFYGSIIIDNQGNINSFPLVKYAKNSNKGIGKAMSELERNDYWYMKRDEYFKKCSDCIFAYICPPVSSYEINSGETFCLD